MRSVREKIMPNARELACSEDLEVLEIVAPADFKTRIVEAPTTQAQAAA
jgi:hypothetical protein